MTKILSLELIVSFLKEQAALRSPENDLGGLLQETAEQLEHDAKQLEAEEQLNGESE